MGEEFINMPGDIVKPENLRIPKAKDLINTIQISPYCRLIGCIRTQFDDEIVVFQTEVELGQRKVYDIQRYEHLAVRFGASDLFTPEVFALRADFPKVPHLNIRENEFPRSLCIFEDPYSELKIHWTGMFFIERIREWLALTAKGLLHGADQPLEPLLPFTNDYLILPGDVYTKEFGSEIFIVKEPIDSGKGRRTLIAERLFDENLHSNPIMYIATRFKCKPRLHGIIASVPTNLLELHEFIAEGDFDLLSELRDRLKIWRNHPQREFIIETKLILTAVLPKLRTERTHPESFEYRTFITENSIKEIGVQIGIWDIFNNNIGPFVEVDKSKNGAQIPVQLMNTVFSLSRVDANRLNGITNNVNNNITMIGVGALGSQVFMNMIRMGYGKWTLIDTDFMLPHNLTRHALDGNSIGFPKSHYLANIANQILDSDPVAEGIIDDILSSSPHESFKNADIILDASTSIAVARYIARDVQSSARRISCFLNPKGTDLIVLAEDKCRNVSLDFLEMQYYRAIINRSSLAGHLKWDEDPIRYSNSCRDVSSVIPQDLIAMHSAICSRALRNIINNEEARIIIWRTSLDDIEVNKHEFPVQENLIYHIGDWTLITDKGLLKKVYKAREKALPNETGGVLIGSHDMERKIIYVVDTVLSPSDSIEWPTVYIRGLRSLQLKLEDIKKRTMGNLRYIGEWHSHPQGNGYDPSQDDYTAFCWLTKVMNLDGLPVLMLIAGDRKRYKFFLGEMIINQN